MGGKIAGQHQQVALDQAAAFDRVLAQQGDNQ